MTLEFIDRPVGRCDGFSSHSFEESDDFNDRWRSQLECRNWWCIKALCDGIEVGRLRLRDRPDDFSEYSWAPPPRVQLIEIEFFDVAQRFRGQGVAAAVIERLAAAHSDRTLLALSEQADGSLAWPKIRCATLLKSSP
ncbi:GNAT family N-acetyltransferase [Nocardia ninae]|uniref:N-acetyltransferase domain-containing protein n=1 Tax=Nocardia ninae NBRC 108245 TaxID=1210091 RepID=A0A511MIB2_9NOCA|nr:GNAT family N-acetyltransferase [Nocardia ninae]GEM40404.1 hypothetical protein NN4_49230 [Nocardia ninae NBRC 108245]